MSVTPSSPQKTRGRLLAIGAIALGAILGGAIFRLSQPVAPPPSSAKAENVPPASVTKLTYLPTPIGAPASEFGRPWVANVQIVDLDQDGLPDVLYGEAQKHSVRWIRQSPRGVFTEQIIGEDVPGPMHVWASDLNGTGRLDVLVASMGQLQPMNDRIGAVFVLEISTTFVLKNGSC